MKGDFTTKEIQKEVHYGEEVCSYRLSLLEKDGVVVYKDGKWKATEEGKKVYAKFFG